MAKSHRHKRRAAPAAPAVDPDSPPGPCVSVRLCRTGVEQCEDLPPERISDVLLQPDVLVWVNVENPGPGELDMLREEFNFHSLTLEDVAHGRQRPKVDEYPDYFFVVLYAPIPGDMERGVEARELDMFAGRNYVVTIHSGPIPALDDAVTRWGRTEVELRVKVGFLLHVITDSVIDAYFPIVDTIEDRLDRIELDIFRAGASFDPEEVLAVKRALYTLRKAVYPLREVFNTFLRRDQAIFSADTYPYFQDAYDHVLRLLDIIDIERDMATGALEAQLSVVSNRLNETMKRLTMIAITVAILGAVFGAWGMNFDAVPLHELGHRGFYIVSGGTLALVVLALALTKWRKLW